MTGKDSFWDRIRRFFRPERETYESRTARGGDAAAPLGTEYYQGTDRRRAGGSFDIGS